MTFEDLLPEVGEQGRFQLLQALTFVLPIIFLGTHFLIENITAFVPPHRCWVRFLDNTSALLNVSENLNYSSLLKLFIPLDSDGKLESCRRFSRPQWQLLPPNVTGQNLSHLESEPCVDGWVYNQSIFTSSIVTEWNLVCDSKSLRSLSQMLFLFGILLGFLIMGYLSDKFGRKRILSLSYFLFAVSSTGAAFAQAVLVYCCFRFLIGFFMAGIFLCSSSLVMEWTTTQHRSPLAVMISLLVSVGHLFIGFLSYGIQEWRKLQLIVSAPFFFFLLTNWWLLESPRWLIVNNKFDDALKMLRKAAKINGKKDKSLTIEDLKSAMKKELSASQTHNTMLDLVRSPILLRRMLCMSFTSFSIGILFYGLTLNLQELGYNVKILQITLGFSSFLSRCGTIFIMNYFGRRTITIPCLFFAGLFTLLCTFMPQGILRATLTMLGINCLVICISCNSVYHTELLPTIVRNRYKGIVLTIDRMGAMLAPVVSILKHYIPALPLIIFALLSITASFAVFFLPETQNKPMPDTIQDLECGHSREEARAEGDPMAKVSQF
ncbi:solute carrier family 22 member 11-like [Sarcophilus harrisii]|uniref:solute carrier family 22 member 11-like n=1 Tax=Sarcophilus harrisii TaxID=9305 RepID=UPI000226E241|nr:solute carrier family 22 member 11-like [Sarcophilus harrisii]